MVRVDQSDLIYRDEAAKSRQVVEDLVARHEKGQPVLVGTTSVEKSERLSQLLAKRGVRHEVLNAKNHAREAVIIAQAGRVGSVTVATNMAGRGTDIMLGGNAEFLAVQEMSQRGLSPVDTPEEYEKQWDQVFADVKKGCDEEGEKVRALGGLYVLGTERHESRRIDNQLRGRSGRQGDPGESRFYLSLEDDLMRLFNAGAAQTLMARSAGDDEDLAIESKVVSRAIQSAQSQVEARNAELRKNVLKYDDVLNRQRQAIYEDRRQILEGDDISSRMREFVERTLETVVTEHLDNRAPEDWDLDQLFTELKTLYPVGITVDELLDQLGLRPNLEDVLTEVQSDATIAYDRREAELGEVVMRELERRVVLSVIDRRWRDHLY
jgi:preprotein translocase subunit SecA